MKRWPLNKAWFWETAPFFRLLLPLMAGIFLYSRNNKLLSHEVVIEATLFAFALLLITGLFKQKNYTVKYLFAFATHAVIFFIAYGLAYYNDIRNDESWFGKQLSANAFTARIIEQPAEKDRTWKLKVEMLNCMSDEKVSVTTGEALVYVYKNEQPIPFHEADTIVLPTGWHRVKNAGNPFEFDYAAYGARHNIYYQQFLAADDILLYAKGTPGDIEWIKRLHNWCMQQLEAYIQDKPTLGLIQAMLIGDEANFDPELRQAYSETGIIHVVAISGSHITIFFVIIAFLLGWIRNRNYQWLKYIIAIPLIWLYVLMAGGPPSAVRAAIMFTILAAGFALQKNPNSLNQLFATAFLLLCAEPMWLFSVGFQLSFLAVLSLILFYRPVYKWLSPVHFVNRAIWASVSASIAAEILVAPLVIYYFHLFPLMFIIANIAAYLFMGLILVAGMLIIGFCIIPVIASYIANMTVWLVSVFNQLVFWLKQFNPPSFYFLDLKIYELALVYAIVIFFSVYIFRKQKGYLFAGLFIVCLLLSSFCYNEWTALHQRKLVVYNISRANHIELIEGNFHNVITTDTSISDKKKNYSLKPAHTAWHSWKEAKKNGKEELFYIGGQSVLILNKPQVYKGIFPVDYVIVNYNAKKVHPGQLTGIFHPRKIILGTELSRRKATEWSAACKQAQIPLHNIIQDGAFISDAFEALP